MARVLEELVGSFRYNAGLRFDLLDQLSDDDLHRHWPRPGLDTFGKQFLEIAAVNEAGARACETGTLDLSSVPDVYDFPTLPRNRIRAALEEADTHLTERLFAAPPGLVVDWGEGLEVGVEVHLNNLISHETLHHGQMVMAAYLFGIPLPASWLNAWSFPSNGRSANEPRAADLSHASGAEPQDRA